MIGFNHDGGYRNASKEKQEDILLVEFIIENYEKPT